MSTPRADSPAVELPTRQEIFGDESPAFTSDHEPREFIPYGTDRFVLTLPTLATSFDLDQVRREHGEWIGELTVCCGLPGARTTRGVLSLGYFNLGSVRARTDLAKLLAAESHAKDINWAGLLLELVIQVKETTETGTASVDLSSVADPGPEPEYEIDGWRLLADHPTILFGDGGTGKSLLALYIAGRLVQRGVSVLYVDWELTDTTHMRRLKGLFGPNPPSVRHVRCENLLRVEARRLRRLVQDFDIKYLVFDSVGAACVEPEKSESAIGYMGAVRQFNRGSLHIAHCTKNAETNDRQPFGSVYWHNAARATWYAKRSGEDAPRTGNDQDYTISVGLFNRKANLTAHYPPLGFAVSFGQGGARIEVARTNLADVADLAEKLPIRHRMMAALQHGMMPRQDLADTLGVKANSISQAVSQHKDVFTIRKRPGTNIVEIGLVERRLGR